MKQHLISLLLALAPSEVMADGKRLRVVNGCKNEPMWIANEGGADSQNIKILPGEYHNFSTPNMLSGTRYWPKFGCNAQGIECNIGESGGPGQGCAAEGCAPPVDTKFEATFGAPGGSVDWVDVSLVDGFTVGFKLTWTGSCSAKQDIDCSAISTDDCPGKEHINNIGDVSLVAVNPASKKAAGCYSPCGKLSFRNWNNPTAADHTPQDAVAAPYCCPTPPETPDSCRKGPVISTNYVDMVHKKCPGVYGYAYDDGVGLMTCDANTTYVITFQCPPSSSATLAEDVVVV